MIASYTETVPQVQAQQSAVFAAASCAFVGAATSGHVVASVTSAHA